MIECWPARFVEIGAAPRNPSSGDRQEFGYPRSGRAPTHPTRERGAAAWAAAARPRRPRRGRVGWVGPVAAMAIFLGELPPADRLKVDHSLVVAPRCGCHDKIGTGKGSWRSTMTATRTARVNSLQRPLGSRTDG